MIVSAITMQQQKVSFPVPLTGFGKAYDGPPADNVKYQEAWRQLMEKSRQRQIELANKIAGQQKEQGTQQPQVGGPPQAGAPVPARATALIRGQASPARDSADCSAKPLACSGCSPIKWFPDRRGMATGMAIMGFGGGAMIRSPLAWAAVGIPLAWGSGSR